ncbi:YkoF family thiamine/hydroxymethylpyrimidine-binding protein [Oceanobacillus halotolerans]|uniref:YkoF family thiamine/hydroxymethylpyrimidine-binding protein n=1 Tax=Oceanobacillus halotolerans TaxID=2663380 RepID=UPI0013D9EE7D|nr:YkoF family thiamine/hydroxymethylpyrimidine-binding protein [Oceanobacillus halotolerans]
MSNQVCNNSNSEIAGASFSIHPMSDNFIEIIQDALQAVDTSTVWTNTDDVSTTVRGKMVHVFDVTKAIFMQAAKTGKHVAFQATYSLGCPGSSTSENVVLAKENEPVNHELVKDIQQYVGAKFALYPLGGGDYMDVISEQIEAMKQYVDIQHTHYATRLDGEALAIFEGLEKVFRATVKGGSSHTVMTVSISANSPSHGK